MLNKAYFRHLVLPTDPAVIDTLVHGTGLVVSGLDKVGGDTLEEAAERAGTEIGDVVAQIGNLRHRRDGPRAHHRASRHPSERTTMSNPAVQAKRPPPLRWVEAGCSGQPTRLPLPRVGRFRWECLSLNFGFPPKPAVEGRRRLQPGSTECSICAENNP
jgi:hypothetical protein